MNKRLPIPIAISGVAVIAAMLILSGDTTSAQTPVAAGSGFTYQGHLVDGAGQPINGTCAITATLWDAETSGSQVGPDVITTITATNGYFSTLLDFGVSPWDGSARWLQIASECPAGADTETFERQVIATIPYAFMAINVISPLTLSAPLRIGNGTETTLDPKIIVADNVTGSPGLNVHSFTDKSVIDRSGDMAVASFDAGAIFTGSNNYDHYAAHKSRLYWRGSGSLSKYYGVYSDLDTNATGVITDSFRFYGQDAIGSAPMINNYGMYLGSMQKGSNVNYAIYTNLGANHFGDNAVIERAWDGATYLRIFNSNSGQSAREYVLLGSNSTSGNYGIIQRFNISYTVNGLYTPTLFAISSAGTEGLLLNSTLSAPIIFATGGYSTSNERFRITPEGDIGIGVSSPQFKLQVNGDVGPVTVTQNLGNASLYWNEVHYHSLVSHSLGVYTSSVRMQDGSYLSCIDALDAIRASTISMGNGLPHVDYRSIPISALIQPLDGKGELGADLDAMASLIICAQNELNQRYIELDKRINALESISHTP